MWQLTYYGGLQNKLREGYGTLYNNDIVIQAKWTQDKVNGAFKVLYRDSLKFIGKAEQLDLSDYESNNNIYNTQKFLVDNPNTQEMHEVV